MPLQYQGIIKNNTNVQLRLNGAEKKILFVLWYYVIFGAVALVSGSLISGNGKNLKLVEEEYLKCQLLGNNTALSHQCHTYFNQISHYTYAWTFAATYFLLSFFPAVNLVFVISWKGAKKMILNQFHQIFHREYQTITEQWIPTTSLSANPTSPVVSVNPSSPTVVSANSPSEVVSRSGTMK